MLGFLRSRLSEQEMLAQQRKAVSGIIRWCDLQDAGVKVTGNTVQAAAGEHLDWVRAMILACLTACDDNKYKFLICSFLFAI